MHQTQQKQYLVVNQYVNQLFVFVSLRRFFIQTELCLQSIYDIVYPSDIEIIKQQLINEKKASPVSTDDSPTDSKCKKKKRQLFLIRKKRIVRLFKVCLLSQQNKIVQKSVIDEHSPVGLILEKNDQIEQRLQIQLVDILCF